MNSKTIHHYNKLGNSSNSNKRAKKRFTYVIMNLFSYDWFN